MTRLKQLAEQLALYRTRIDSAHELHVSGELTEIIGLRLEAIGFSAPIGAKCLIKLQSGGYIEAEVVGFAENKILLMSTSNTQGLTPGAKVIPLPHTTDVQVGEELLGRVIDGAGTPLDGKGVIHSLLRYPILGKTFNPLVRAKIETPLDVGVRALNALCTVGRGQRLGLFAGSGVGKSVLMGMMTRNTTADVTVVGLIGERGREIKEFIEDILGENGLARAVVVAAPADTSPLSRLYGAMRATAIAEYFRDQGKHVLLLLDSLTRYAQAQRELGLAIGEPPATKGYPPSVFSKIAQLIERTGNGPPNLGSITGIYTVLVEGDDHNDPIADSARSILDGHIVLARRLAEMGVFPAIDVEASISRVMPLVVEKLQWQAAAQFKMLYSKYQQNSDLLKIGAYVPGGDLELDRAIVLFPDLQKFIKQDLSEAVNFATSKTGLLNLVMPATQ